MVFMTKHTQNCHNTKAIAVLKEKRKKWGKMRVKIANSEYHPLQFTYGIPTTPWYRYRCAAVCQNPKPYLYPWYPFWKHQVSCTHFKPYP